MKPRSLKRVIEGELCSGCGLCAARPGDRMVLDERSGYARPRFASSFEPAEEKALLAACPGANVETRTDPLAHYETIWGPIVECRAGAAADPEISFKGSSGGGLTALLCYLLESGRIDGVIQIGADPDSPMLSSPRISRSREQIVSCAGSRYAPSPTLDHLLSQTLPGETYALIGKPCDIAAFRGLCATLPEMGRRIPYALSFMCAGVPSQKGTNELLVQMQAEPASVRSFRYRGYGWPGDAVAAREDGYEHRLSYRASWGGVLSKHLQFRCKICPDGTGESADVVCGDAWYGDDSGYPDFAERDGRSLIISRTAGGEELIKTALAAGVIVAGRLDVKEIEKMQPYQLKRRRTVLSRTLAMRAAGHPVPAYRGMALLASTKGSSLWLQIRAFLGTLGRLLASKRG